MSKKLGSIALAASSAVLYVLACPPWNVVPLAFVCWTPLLFALRGASPRRALWLGVVHGALVAVLLLGWMGPVFLTFVDGNRALAVLLTVLLLVAYSLRYAPIGIAVVRAEARGWPRSLAFAASLVCVEGASAWFVPWYSGYQLHAAPRLAQAADLGGPLLLTFLLALANAGAERALAAARGRAPLDRAALGAALGIPALLAGYGTAIRWLTTAQEAAAPSLRVGVIQLDEPTARDTAASLERYRRESVTLGKERGVDLVIWPETAIGVPLREDALEETLRAQAELPQEKTRPAILSGVLFKRAMGGRLANGAALLLGDGRLAGSYGKVHGMPLGEYLPFGDVFPNLYSWFPNAGRLAVSDRARTIDAFGHRIQVRVCYEEALPAATREAVVENEPDLLVGLTNDAWFGASPAWAMHLAAARFRAIEHHRYYVRAVNNGPSAIVDPRGDMVVEAPAHTQGIIVGDVRWVKWRTLYQRVGEMPAYLVSLFAAVMLFVRAPRPRGWGLPRRTVIRLDTKAN